MVDDRVLNISPQGFKSLTNPENGKGYHWACDINTELPVKLEKSGPGSTQPLTMPQLFDLAVKERGNQEAMFVERGGRYLSWTWNQYDQQVRQFAKSLAQLNVTTRSAVAIMGFNSPEWAISCMGAMMYEAVVTGIYITNEPDACLYQATHCEAEVVVCESLDHLKRFTVNLDKLPRVKAFVVWGEDKLPQEFQGPQYFLWRDFLKLGSNIKDQEIQRRADRQVPGQCCCLIYTSGTTGNPTTCLRAKGCMLSHDNLTWGGAQLFLFIERDKPGFCGPHNRIVSYLPLSHIAGMQLDMCCHLFNKCELYFARPDALQGTLVETLKFVRPTVFLAVPRVWEKFEDKLKEVASQAPALAQKLSGWAKGYGTANVQAQLQRKDPPMLYSLANFLILSKIKKAIGLDACELTFFGAAPLKKTTIDYFASLDIILFNLYGMSETSGATTTHAFSKFRLDAAGFTIPGCGLKIANPDENGEGEICMRGRNTMMGYLKNEKATMDTLDEEGYIKSGDKGKIDSEGFLKITGRIKELIITAGGENVAPVPIEDSFKQFCPPCSNIMMVGEQQRFMGALITFKVDVDMKTGLPSKNLLEETRIFFKKELGLDLKTSDEACKEPKVAEFVKQCIEKTNGKAVSRAAHIRKFKLLPEDFSIPGGELTPTMKLKRKVTEKKYAQFLDEMFAVQPKL